MINNYDNDDDENKLEDDGNSYQNDEQQLKNWKQDKDRDNNNVDDKTNYQEIDHNNDERDNRNDNDKQVKDTKQVPHILGLAEEEIHTAWKKYLNLRFPPSVSHWAFHGT